MSDEQHIEPQDELSDDELEQVAGGFDPQPDPPKQLVNKNSQPPSANITDGTSNTILVSEQYQRPG